MGPRETRARRKRRLIKGAACLLVGVVISLSFGFAGNALDEKVWGWAYFTDPASQRPNGWVIRGVLYDQAMISRASIGSPIPEVTRAQAIAAIDASWRDPFVDPVYEQRMVERARDMASGSFSLRSNEIYTASTTIVVVSGWPLRCVWGMKSMTGSVDSKGAAVGSQAVVTRVEGLLDPGVGTPNVFVYYPYRPLFLPLLVNTVFFAGVIGLVWWAPGAVRREWRRSRVCCVHCGYQLRSRVAKCPECGRNAVAGTDRDSVVDRGGVIG